MSGRFWTASKVGSSCLVFSHLLVYLDSQDRSADGCDLKRMMPMYVSKAQIRPPVLNLKCVKIQHFETHCLRESFGHENWLCAGFFSPWSLESMAENL